MGSTRRVAPTGSQEQDQGRRLFTVAEARRALPLVRRIVRDIVREFARLKGLHERSRELSLFGPQEDFEQSRREHAEVVDRLNQYAEELSHIGCVLEKWEGGLVDFPAWYDGREVYLCWRLGEPDVAHWHELHAGFAERQPLVAESADEPTPEKVNCPGVSLPDTVA